MSSDRTEQGPPQEVPTNINNAQINTNQSIVSDNESKIAANPFVTPALVSTIKPGTGNESESLAQLLEHIASLQKTNSEMSQTLTNIQTKNMEKFNDVVGSKIEPWVKSLNIPEEQQKSFLEGIKIACEQGHKKGIVDFEVNPAFSIACAAATAHGAAIESAEKMRLEVLAANANLESQKLHLEKESRNNNNNNMSIIGNKLRNDNVLSSTASELGKRGHEAVYSHEITDETTSSCWNQVFDNMCDKRNNI